MIDIQFSKICNIFAKILSALVILVLVGTASAAVAQNDLAGAMERFAGEARLGSQPAFPIHIELRRSGEGVGGTVSIADGKFEIVEARGADAIIGRFRGDAGSGPLTLRVGMDVLDGKFELAGQPGVISARRTSEDAETFFRPPYQRLDLTAYQWNEDLDRLVEILTLEHASPFHKISRERFTREVARVRAEIPRVDGIGVALELRKLGALIGDGHTSVALPNGRPQLPLELYWFDDGLRVVSVAAGHQSLLGVKLIAVNDVPVADVARRMSSYVAQGETRGFDRAEVPKLLNNPDILRAAGIGSGPSFTFVFDNAQGTRLHLDAAAQAVAVKSYTLGGGAPLWRQNATKGFWTERLADGSAYVNWRSYSGLADHSATLLKTLDAKHPRRLIIDLRDNDGGDYNVGRAFIQAIKSRPWLNQSGILYVLIGRKTFSAAMTNAIDLKKLTAATLVGEAAGAAPNNWQEVRRFYLPNSKLRIGVSTRYYEFNAGEDEVLPDHRVPPVVGDWGSPQDAALKFVLDQPVP